MKLCLMLALASVIFVFGCSTGKNPALDDAALSVDRLTPIIAEILAEPIPVKLTDGKYHLAYELILSNPFRHKVTVDKIEISAAGKTVATLNSKAITRQLKLVGAKKPTNVFQPGQCGALRIDLQFKKRKMIPETLTNTIFSVVDSKSPNMSNPDKFYKTTLVKVAGKDPAVIGPPLKGGRWIATGVGSESAHRATIMPVNGNWKAAQRWAVDWLACDKDNRMVNGKISSNKSYPQYGREIIAVADGVIVATTDGLPDLTPGVPPKNIKLQDAGGNNVIQRLDNGLYAFYAHMQPGSLKVKRGDRVARGQTLGLLGNSGNTDAAHLHFQVMQGPAGLGSNGQPYVIDSFKLLGTIKTSGKMMEFEDIKKTLQIMPAGKNNIRRNEMPASLAVIEFPK